MTTRVENEPSRLFEILFEDPDLLVINKPAGLVCHPTKGDVYSSLISRVRLYLQRRAGLNANAEAAESDASTPAASAHIVTRLDRETSGVVLVALNSRTAGELGKLLEKRLVEKTYLAIVHGTVPLDYQRIELPLGKDEKSRVAVKDTVRPDGVAAQTEVSVERRFERSGSPFTLVRVAPGTGRKHQIRIHLAAIGHPVVGDKLYGGDEDLYMALVEDRLTPEQRQRLILPNQALHAMQLRFSWRGQPATFTAQPDKEFSAFVAA